MQFFNEKNFDAAKICFRRSGDAKMESWAEAAGLRAEAWQIRGFEYDTSNVNLTKAANIFLSIKKYHEAAQCFYESEQYALAGTNLL